MGFCYGDEKVSIVIFVSIFCLVKGSDIYHGTPAGWRLCRKIEVTENLQECVSERIMTNETAFQAVLD